LDEYPPFNGLIEHRAAMPLTREAFTSDCSPLLLYSDMEFFSLLLLLLLLLLTPMLLLMPMLLPPRLVQI
jgi:hypothetical protein